MTALLLALAASVSLTVYPRACFSPCEVRVTVRIEGAKAGDQLRVEFDSAEFSASHPLVHEGQRTYMLPRNTLYGTGIAIVRAIVVRRDGREEVVEMRVELAGGEP